MEVTCYMLACYAYGDKSDSLGDYGGPLAGFKPVASRFSTTGSALPFVTHQNINYLINTSFGPQCVEVI